MKKRGREDGGEKNLGREALGRRSDGATARSGDDAHVHTSINKERMHASHASISGSQRVPAGASEKYVSDALNLVLMQVQSKVLLLIELKALG